MVRLSIVRQRFCPAAGSRETMARSYQLLGEYERALYWFDQVQKIGDKDLQYDAAGQFLFVLDVNMTAKELASLDSSRLPAWVKGWASYSLAVEYLRERDYRKASEALQEFIDTYENKDPQLFAHEQDYSLVGQSYYPFWNYVREQLSLAKELAQLTEAMNQSAGAEKAKRQYELAAKISKNPLLYYNHLWRGERQGFFWLGQIKSMDYQVELDRYIARFNHLLQAADLFAQINLDEADQETGAKTLFSLILMNSKLIEYGEEVAFHLPKSMLGQRILQYGDQLITRYPGSQLADDALLLIYHYTNDTGKLQELLARYPQSDKAAEAQKILQERSRDPQRQYRYNPLQTNVPVQKLDENDWQLSANIKKWVDQYQGKPGRYTQRDGEWLYAYLVPAQGKQAYVSLQTDLASATFLFGESTLQKAGNQKERGTVLLRVPYRFVQHAKVTWNSLGN